MSICKSFILFLAVACLAWFAYEPKSNPQQRNIAVLIKRDFRGEISFAHRIRAACKNLGWKAAIVDIENREELQKNIYDFVINLVPGSYPHSGCSHYLALFHPVDNFFKKKGTLQKKYRCYDGYLLTYPPGPFRHKKSFEDGRARPYMPWYPTVQKRAYKQNDPAFLFHICSAWSNRFEDPKFQQLLNWLDKEPYMRFYGSSIFGSLYPKSYRGPIPYDDESLFETAGASGISLIFHAEGHNKYGLPSGRIFEAAAASTVIICDQNTFVQKQFGDSVLYIDTNQDALSILNQIRTHMDWIRDHKEEALEKAKKAHDIYKERFLLEDQLLRLGEFHDRIAKRSKKGIRKWLEKRFPSVFRGAVNQRFSIDPIPAAAIVNPCSSYTLINSVDFHPQKNLFCVTYTNANRIILYQIDKTGKPEIFQTLCNPSAQLNEPQHAAFSPDGTKMAVANWTNQTIAMYSSNRSGSFSEAPTSVIPSPSCLIHHKPHGIAFSPCGQFLAVAYGAASYYGRAIALFRFKKKGMKMKLASLLEELPGIPKGITFSPDGKCLLVTFSDTNSLTIFDVDRGKILPKPRQMIAGPKTQIFRPEDVKINASGNYCAVSNSDQDTVSFYAFDRKTNRIVRSIPDYVLKNPEAQLRFPHGIAFSPDGAFLLLTEFGSVPMTSDGDIDALDSNIGSDQSKVRLYRMK